MTGDELLLKVEIEQFRKLNERLQAKVDRLTARGIEEMQFENGELRAEIERLRELVDAGKDDRKAIDELVDENKRLRGLLRQCQPFVDRLQPPTLDLSVELAEELKRGGKDDRKGGIGR